MFLFKLLSTPLLIAVATLLMRRWGPAVGGAFASMPLMSGPVSVFFLLEQGPEFAASSAVASMMGLACVGAFGLAYRHASRHMSWFPSTVVSLSVFFALTLILRPLARTPLPTLCLSCGLLALFVALLGRLPKRGRPAPSLWWDLPLRMTVAGILILLLTGGASLLGPVWGGFLSVFPVFTVLMAAFTQAECGPDTVALLIHSSLVGQTGTIVFSFVVAECVTTLGGAVTYPLALLSCLTVNGLLLAIMHHRHAHPSKICRLERHRRTPART